MQHNSDCHILLRDKVCRFFSCKLSSSWPLNLSFTVNKICYPFNVLKEKFLHSFASKTSVFSWRDGSVHKSTGCSSRVSGFNSQHPCGSSELSVTSVLGGLTPSHRHTCAQNTNKHKTKINKSLKDT